MTLESLPPRPSALHQRLQMQNERVDLIHALILSAIPRARLAELLVLLPARHAWHGAGLFRLVVLFLRARQRLASASRRRAPAAGRPRRRRLFILRRFWPFRRIERQEARTRASRSSPSPSTITLTVPPCSSLPNSSSSASGFLMCSWMTRASGRAPNFSS